MLIRWLRLHPRVQGLKFKAGTKRAEVANAIDNFVGGTADKGWVTTIDGPAPADLTAEERKEWISKLTGVALSSDAFFPFADNIHRAKLVSLRITERCLYYNVGLCVPENNNFLFNLKVITKTTRFALEILAFVSVLLDFKVL
jgi:hypothetical protein